MSNVFRFMSLWIIWDLSITLWMSWWLVFKVRCFWLPAGAQLPDYIHWKNIVFFFEIMQLYVGMDVDLYNKYIHNISESQNPRTSHIVSYTFQHSAPRHSGKNICSKAQSMWWLSAMQDTFDPAAIDVVKARWAAEKAEKEKERGEKARPAAGDFMSSLVGCGSTPSDWTVSFRVLGSIFLCIFAMETKRIGQVLRADPKHLPNRKIVHMGKPVNHFASTIEIGRPNCFERSCMLSLRVADHRFRMLCWNASCWWNHDDHMSTMKRIKMFMLFVMIMTMMVVMMMTIAVDSYTVFEATIYDHTENISCSYIVQERNIFIF